MIQKYFEYFQSRRLHLATETFLWPEQRCQILCIFCYFRLPWGNRKVALARATLPIHLYFLQLSCQGRPLRSGNLKLPEIQRNWQRCSGQSNFPVAPGQSKVAKYTKNLATLLWPEERYCCQVQPSRMNVYICIKMIYCSFLSSDTKKIRIKLEIHNLIPQFIYETIL